MKKQLLTIALITAVTFGMTACDKKEKTSEKAAETELKATAEEENHEAGEHMHKHEEGTKCDPATCDPAKCEHHKKEGAATDKAEAEEMAYICPMKCEGSASHEAGKCPVCKMDLKKAEEVNTEEKQS